MKDLMFPVGISNFEKIREGGYYYIDKTNLISELLSGGIAEVLLLCNRPRNCRDCISIQVTYSCGLDYCCTKESVNPECIEKSRPFQSFRKASELYPTYFTFSATKNQWTNTPKSIALHNYSCRIF